MDVYKFNSNFIVELLQAKSIITNLGMKDLSEIITALLIEHSNFQFVLKMHCW